MSQQTEPRRGTYQRAGRKFLVGFLVNESERATIQDAVRTNRTTTSQLLRAIVLQTLETPANSEGRAEIRTEQDKITELTAAERKIVTRVRDSLIGRADYTHDGTLRGEIVHELMQFWQMTEPEAVSMADWAVADLCVREGVLT